jgi:phospholipid/cholesterol/gamma-HCH transport system substrate-binding protein
VRSKPNRATVNRVMSVVGAILRHRAWQGLALLVAAMVLSSCGSWRGISNVAIPGGPGDGGNSYKIYVQVPDTLAINGNSKVMVADVFEGSIKAIELCTGLKATTPACARAPKDGWTATLTLGVSNSVKLPKNAIAKIGQTSLLGSQHVELSAPPNPLPGFLSDGCRLPDGKMGPCTILLKNSSSYPTTEQTLASLSLILHGGGIPNLEALQNEVYNIFNGRGDQIRSFLGKLDTFTRQLNEQRDDITHAIDSTNRLLG